MSRRHFRVESASDNRPNIELAEPVQGRVHTDPYSGRTIHGLRGPKKERDAIIAFVESYCKDYRGFSFQDLCSAMAAGLGINLHTAKQHWLSVQLLPRDLGLHKVRGSRIFFGVKMEDAVKAANDHFDRQQSSLAVLNQTAILGHLARLESEVAKIKQLLSA